LPTGLLRERACELTVEHSTLRHAVDERQRGGRVTWVEVVVLGIVQGLTEFLPISSSAHLRIVSEVFFGRDAGAAFTAVTQLGTEAAVLIYFARDIGRLTMAWLRGLTRQEARADPDYRLAWLVILGTLPIGVLGLAFEDQIQTAARNLWLIATTLVVFGVLLGVAERVGRQKVDLERVTVGQGLTLGLAQAMALIPGVSRSGGTITAGLFLGLTRPAAVRFSFLLAIPAVVASGIFQLPDVFTPGGPSGAQMVVATLIAFALGYVSIAWLLRFVEHHSVYVFVGYRIALGAVLFAALGTGWISAT
jgi:undecaprenyl-diphosphatase